MDEEDLTDQSYVTLVVTVVVLMLAVVVILAYLMAIIQPAWMKNVIEYFKAITTQRKKSDNAVTSNNAAGKKTHDDRNNHPRGNKSKTKKEKSLPHRRQSQSSVQEIPIHDDNSTDRDVSSVQSCEESSKKSLRNRKPTVKKQHVEEVAVETLASHNTEEESFVWIPDGVPETKPNKKKHGVRKKKKGPTHPQIPGIHEINQNQKQRGSLSSDSSKANQEAPRKKITCHEKKNCYHFTLDETGGIIEFPFGKADFPKNAVSESTLLRFVSLNTKSYGDENITLITPAIHCSRFTGYDCVDFKLPINIEMKTLNKESRNVEVQVTQSSIDLRWETIEKCRILKEKSSISFNLQQFAGFRIIFRNRESCSIYHTVYVKRPTGISDPSQHNFSVLMHSKHEDLGKTRESTIRSGTAHVISEPQTIDIRPPCTLTMSLSCDGMDSFPMEHEFHINEPNEYFIKNFNIQLKKQDRDIPIDLCQNIDLTYSASSEFENTHQIPFQWSVPFVEPMRSRRESRDGSVISAYGPSSVGVIQHFHHYNSNHDNRHPGNVAREQSSPATFSRVQSAEEISSQRHLDQSLSEPILHTEDRCSTPAFDNVTPDLFNFTGSEDADVHFSLSQE